MPTYDYLCKSCGCTFETKHGFNDSPSPCPKCEKTDLAQVFDNPPIVFVKGEPTTLGQLAERNTSSMGRYELENHRAEREEIHKQDDSKNTRRKINKMTPKQRQKYIEEG